MPHAGTPPTSCSVGEPCAAQPDSCCGASANCAAGGERPDGAPCYRPSSLAWSTLRQRSSTLDEAAVDGDGPGPGDCGCRTGANGAAPATASLATSEVCSGRRRPRRG